MALEFNKSDFENIIFSNIFVNQTSGTECKEPKKINLIEVSKVGITLRVPTKSCNVNHSLLVVFFEGDKPKIPKILANIEKNKDVVFSGIGKIKEKTVTENPDESEIKIEYSQFDKSRWGKIVLSLKTKQERMMELLDKMKVTEA